MRSWWWNVAAFALAFCACKENSFADELITFGHHLSVLKGSDLQTQLKVGGKLLHENYYVSITEIGIVDGVPVVIGDSSAGGNACAGSPFVLSFPAGKSPRLDGPLESCRPVSRKLGADHIVFATTPSASQDGEMWEWTPSGFTKGGNTIFNADRSMGWDDLRSREVGHPSDLLRYGDVAEQLYALLASDRQYVVPILEGVGSARYEGDYLIGQSCLPHMCTVVEQVIVASLRDRRIFIAWKPEDEKIVVRPRIKEWPEEARRALSLWAQTWR